MNQVAPVQTGGPVPLELMDAPAVTLGKREWKVPEFAARQNRRLLPLIMRSLSGLSDAMNLTQEQTDALFEAGYIALTRGYPNLTREQFDDLPVTASELMRALPIIAKQAGMETGKTAAGEAQAEGALKA